MFIFVVRDEESEVVYKGFDLLEAEKFGLPVQVWEGRKMVGHYVNKHFVRVR